MSKPPLYPHVPRKGRELTGGTLPAKDILLRAIRKTRPFNTVQDLYRFWEEVEAATPEVGFEETFNEIDKIAPSISLLHEAEHYPRKQYEIMEGMRALINFLAGNV